MDELNNLKQAWQAFSDVNKQKQYSAEELQQIVKKKSNSELQKIQRKLLFEWGLAILVAVAMVVVVSIIKPADIIYALLFVGLILGVSFIPYYKILVFRLNQNQDLKNHLNSFIQSFENLVRQYVRMSAFLLPFAIAGGFLLGFHSSADHDTWLLFFNAKNISILVATIILISFAGYYIQRKYFNWVYGKNIQRLNDCLSDLEEVDE